MTKAPRKRSSPKPVTSLAAFARRIETVTLEWAPEREFDPWFRGHGSTDWPLVPGIYRTEEIAEEEDNYREDFKLRALPYLIGSAREPSSEWEWYFLMQHWGLPTRLLDWTRSALVALYFAVRDKESTKDAAVWVLDPWSLNQQIARKGFLYSATDRGVQGYLREPFSNRGLPRNPIALEAAFNSTRIAAQRGCFTLHGSTRKALDRYAALKARLLKIEIARIRVPEIREQLRVLGITETSVFPDLSGLCTELKDYWLTNPK